MICPDCGHPAEEHTEFYCLHVGCLCNLPRTTAEARCELNIAREHLELAKKGLKLIIVGKSGVNLSSDYLRGYDIGIAEETLRQIECF